MDKGLTVPKLKLIVWLKIPQMPQNSYAQFVCPSPKVLDFNEKRLHWGSVHCCMKCPQILREKTLSQKSAVIALRIQCKLSAEGNAFRK